jgi:hypothetical protein
MRDIRIINVFDYFQLGNKDFLWFASEDLNLYALICRASKS